MFDDEMKDIAKAELGGNYITKPGVEIVTLKSYKMSPTDASFKGCPYVEVTFETIDDTKSINTARLYRVRPQDTESSKEWKLKRIKELFTNAGANWELKGEAVIASAMGNQVKALFKEKEYVGVDGNNNNKPEIRTKIEYSFSARADAEINGNQSYLRGPLDEKGQAQLAADLEKWNRDNPQDTAPAEQVAAAPVAEATTQPATAPPAAAPAQGGIDDLPF
jgi:hypothetical protein